MNDYNQEFHYGDDLLTIHLSGVFPNELFRSEQNIFQPLIDECLAKNCKLVLVDARDLRIRLDTMEIFRAGEDAAALRSYGLRVALVAREEMIDPFFEDVTFNRGGNVGVFTDIDTARDWLKS